MFEVLHCTLPKSESRYSHAHTQAVDNRVSLTAFIGRDVKCAAEAALICSRAADGTCLVAPV